jgi:hypothetical protein
MSSDDPYHALPNLAGSAAGIEEVRSSGDPSRFFPSSRGGNVDAVTGRILNMPRCRVYGPGVAVSGAAVVVPWNTVDYDTDNMTKRSIALALIDIVTPGFYLLKTHGESPGGTGTTGWLRIILNGNPGVYIASTTGLIPPAYALHMDVVGIWPLRAGDFVQAYWAPAGAAGLYGGQYASSLEACMISSFGSDNP